MSVLFHPQACDNKCREIFPKPLEGAVAASDEWQDILPWKCETCGIRFAPSTLSPWRDWEFFWPSCCISQLCPGLHLIAICPVINKMMLWTSLLVQWLGICLPMQGIHQKLTQTVNQSTISQYKTNKKTFSR